MDQISFLDLGDKLKLHLLLRQVDFSRDDDNTVVGVASGSYYVSDGTAALRNIYQNTVPAEKVTRSPKHADIMNCSIVSHLLGNVTVVTDEVEDLMMECNWQKIQSAPTF